jgi:hypothetical protein
MKFRVKYGQTGYQKDRQADKYTDRQSREGLLKGKAQYS